MAKKKAESVVKCPICNVEAEHMQDDMYNCGKHEFPKGVSKEELEDIYKRMNDDSEEFEIEEIDEEESALDDLGLDGKDDLAEVIKDKETDESVEYVGFKVNAKQLIDFLKIINCKGPDTSGKDTVLMENCVFVVGTNKVVTLSVDTNEYVILSLALKVETYKTDGMDTNLMPIDIKGLIETLGRFKSSDVRVLYNGEKIMVIRDSPKLVWKLDCIDISSVTTFIKADFPITFVDGVPTHKNGSKMHCKLVTKGEFLKELLEDSKSIGVRYFPFVCDIKKKQLTVSVSNLIATKSMEREIKSTSMTSLDNKRDNFSSSYSHGFGNVVNNLSQKITLYFDDNEYLYITKETGAFKLDILITNSQVMEDARVEIESDDFEFEEF